MLQRFQVLYILYTHTHTHTTCRISKINIHVIIVWISICIFSCCALVWHSVYLYWTECWMLFAFIIIWQLGIICCVLAPHKRGSGFIDRYQQKIKFSPKQNVNPHTVRTALFWDITQRVVVISYRLFGTIYRPHLQVPESTPCFSKTCCKAETCGHKELTFILCILWVQRSTGGPR